jgi:hypothetical protein
MLVSAPSAAAVDAAGPMFIIDRYSILAHNIDS